VRDCNLEETSENIHFDADLTLGSSQLTILPLSEIVSRLKLGHGYWIGSLSKSFT